MRGRTRIIALSAVLSGVPACGGSPPEPAAEARAPIDVTAQPVVSIEAVERLEAGGVVAARRSASVSSRIVATIATVQVTAGARVRAGDVLVTLDAREVVEQVRQLRAGARAAEQALVRARSEQDAATADHRLAVAWHTRITALHGRNSATTQERDEADARLAAAAARLAGASAAIQAAEANLASAQSAVAAAEATESYTSLRAPFDGLVTERLTDPGNLAVPGIPLLRIDADGPREVVVRVDEARAGFVHPGDRVDLEIGGTGEPGAAPNLLEGVVAEVARAVSADQRAFTVKVSLPRTVTARTGSFARVLFRGAPRRALFIPPAAIHRHGQVSSVFVVQDGVARLRLIQEGTAETSGVEVLTGVESGELVVMSPAARVVDGIPVTVGTTDPSPGAAK